MAKTAKYRLKQNLWYQHKVYGWVRGPVILKEWRQYDIHYIGWWYTVSIIQDDVRSFITTAPETSFYREKPA